MGVADLGRVGGVDDVAEKRQGAAQADGMARHAGDDRLFDIEQAVDHPLALPDRAREGLRIAVHVIEPIEIATGAKGAAGAGKDDYVGLFVARHIVENTRQFPVQLRVDGVELLGPVHG